MPMMLGRLGVALDSGTDALAVYPAETPVRCDYE